MARGRIRRARPRSRQEAYSRGAKARSIGITKEAVRMYLNSFFDTQGYNRTITEAAGKAALQYVTDESFDPSEDLTQRKLMLAKMFERVKERLPAILIIDAGFTPKPDLMGLGGLQDYELNEDGNWYGRYPIIAAVPLTVSMVSKDPDTTDVIGSIINLAFGVLRQLACGSVLRSNVEGEIWEVRLPLTYSASGISSTNITEDPVDSVYSRTFDIEPEFEDHILLKREQAVMTSCEDSPRNIDPNETDLSATMPPIIVCENSIKLNERTFFNVQKLRIGYRIIVDDFRIALIDLSRSEIVPRRLGDFKLRVLDKESEIVAEKAVTVVP